jgi:DNA-binding transcriptional ArsR family regulator
MVDNNPDEPSPEVLDRVFSALADPIRRTILTRLDGEDLLVSDLAEPFDVSLQAVSKHIQVLVKAGLVVQERTGRISRCRLDAGPIYQSAVWINRYMKYWQAQFDTLAIWLDEIERANPQQEADSDKRDAPRLPHSDSSEENPIKSSDRSESIDAISGHNG